MSAAAREHARVEPGTPAEPLAGSTTELLRALARAFRAHQLYLANNPMHARAVDAVRETFARMWSAAVGVHAVTVLVRETELALEDGSVVLEEASRGGDALPWLLYQDGIRRLTFYPGVEGAELDLLLDVLQRARLARGGADDDPGDLVALLWECDFERLTYEYVEAGPDGPAAPGAELLVSAPRRGSVPAPGELEHGEPGQGEPESDQEADRGGARGSGFARVDEQDATLYFLEEREIAYLRDAIRGDFAADLRATVVAGLLDTWEQETGAPTRDEIAGHLESLFVQLLTARALGGAAYLVREVTQSAARGKEVTPSQRDRLKGLAGQVSDPAVLGPLIEAVDDALGGSAGAAVMTDLAELLGQLRPSALALLLRQAERARNGALRAALKDAATRLATGATGEVVRLLESDDPVVVREAVALSGALRSPAAVAVLARVLATGEGDLRRAAAEALASIGSPGALQVLEGALEDGDRSVRIVAADAMAAGQYRAAVARLERVIRSGVLAAGTATERSAFFDAYAALAGAAAVPLLAGILLPRRLLLSRREEPAARAAAATALGRVGTARAMEALRRGAADRDVIVRSAAARALRAPHVAADG